MNNLNPFLRQCYTFFSACCMVALLAITVGCGGSSGSSQTDPPPPETQPDPDVQIKPAPKGVYHSAGIIEQSNNNTTLVRAEINSQDYVTGTLVRVSWSAVNPSEGVYDFSAIENELEQAALYDSAINLAILDSKETPDYILQKCQTFSYIFRGVETAKTCLPWDSQYQAYKQQLISLLAEKFDSNANLAGVYFTYAAMTNGVEMHWRVDESDYTAAGYSPELLIQSYNDIMDMYAEAFKSTNIIMEIHAVFNDSFLAENAFAHCHDKLAERCGVAIWWCASRIATNPNELEYQVYNVAQKATRLSFAVCQSIASFVNSPDSFDQGQGWTTVEAFRHEMDFFIGEGFGRFELWSKDIQDPELVDIIEEYVLPQI